MCVEQLKTALLQPAVLVFTFVAVELAHLPPLPLPHALLLQLHPPLSLQLLLQATLVSNVALFESAIVGAAPTLDPSALRLAVSCRMERPSVVVFAKLPIVLSAKLNAVL